MGEEGFVLVLTAIPDRRSAEMLAEAALKQRLAFGAQIQGGVTSLRLERGEVRIGDESRILLTTTAALAMRLIDWLSMARPLADRKEVIAIPILAGHPPYLERLREELGHLGPWVLEPHVRPPAKFESLPDTD